MGKKTNYLLLLTLILVTATTSFFLIENLYFSPESNYKDFSNDFESESKPETIEEIYTGQYQISDSEAVQELTKKIGLMPSKKGIISQEDSAVEEKIYEELQSNDQVNIVVKLKDNFDNYDLDYLKQKSLDNTEDLISEIGNSNSEKNIFNVNQRYELFNGFAAKVDRNMLEILATNPSVEKIYLDKKLELSLSTTTYLMGARDLWPRVIGPNNDNVTGKGQTVCVVDSGIYYQHSGLGGCIGPNCKVKAGYDFVNNDNDPEDGATSTGGHGTQVAGIISLNPSQIPYPIRGVASDTSLVIAKACDNNGCPVSKILAATDYCVSNINNFGIDVITMSLGGGGPYGPESGNCEAWLDSSLELARYMGVSITAASGNNGWSNGITYPACSPSVISVGSLGQGCQDLFCGWGTQIDRSPIAYYTNTGQDLDLLSVAEVARAPNISGLNSYGGFSGTSSATPHVAGAISLLKQLDPLLTPYQIEKLFKVTSEIVTDPINSLTFSKFNVFKAARYFASEKESRITEDVNISRYVSTDQRISDFRTYDIHVAWTDNRDGNFEIYYSRLWPGGNKIISDKRLTFYENASERPKIKIHQDTSPIKSSLVWVDKRQGNSKPEIYYTRLNENGDKLFEEVALTNIGQYTYPDLDTDSQYAHIVYSAGISVIPANSELFYLKVDQSGNKIIDTRITFSNGHSGKPSISLDSSNNLHVVWQDYRDGNNEIYYKKIDSNGNTLVNDIRLTSNSFNSETPAIETSQNFANIVWVDDRDGNKEIYYTKLDNNGNTIIDDLRISYHNSDSLDPSISVRNILNPPYLSDLPNQSVIVWTDNRDIGNGEIYYSKIKQDGTILEDQVRLTNNQQSSLRPKIIAAPNKFYGGQIIPLHDLEDYILWEDNRDGNMEIYYKVKSDIATTGFIVTHPSKLSYHRGTGSLQNNIMFYFDSPLNAGQQYILALSLNNATGITLGNNHIPLDTDSLFWASVANPQVVGLSANSMGVLDSNGRATIFLSVPPISSLSGITIHASVVAVDNLGHISAISNPVNLVIG